MSKYSPRSVLNSLSYEIRAAGLDKSKTPVPNVDLIAKDQLVQLIIELMEQFIKQQNFDSYAAFFISWSYKKYSLKLQTARFVQSFEYSMEVHSKFYEELVFLQYLLNVEDGKDVIRFYLRSRRILMSFFYGDSNYHDAETTNLELEHWMNIATRIFTEIPSPKSIERINSILVRKAVQVSNNSIRKTVDAVSFLEQCVLEFMRVTNLGSGRGKSPGGRSVSPISRPGESPFKITHVDNSPSHFASPNRATSPIRSAHKNFNHTTSFVAKFDLDSPGAYQIMNKKGYSPTRKSPYRSPVKNTPSVYVLEQGEYDIPDLYDQDNNFIASGSKTPNKNKSPTRYQMGLEQRKEKRFLTSELQDQNNEKRRIEEYLDRVMAEFNNFSRRHDKVIDFTVALQKNFLHVFEQIKAHNSDLLEDDEVREIYRRTASFNNYEKNYLMKLHKMITPKDNLHREY